MNQAELTGLFCPRPQNFAWFLGAGASRAAGLPTASDIIWDLKKRYYSREENQDISRQDIQNQAVRDRIQSFMDSQGFPSQGSADEYVTYFERIFKADKERQRKYLKAILSEEHVTLTVGNRIIGAMLASGMCRAAFTTNFDSVVERAVAEVGGASLSAYHLEGSHTAVQALNNEEFPFYCKLHGDFRYDSLKNLPTDLAEQNDALSQCLVNAGNRFGFIVAGYSGRDASIMDLFRMVLTSQNPFPHGLFWTGMKGSSPAASVNELLQEARTRGVTTEYIEIETLDTFLLRLWRNIDSKPSEMDAKVRKSKVTMVTIPLTPTGTANPVIRMNALPLIALPTRCLSLSFRQPKDWDELRRTRDSVKAPIILTKSPDSTWCWGLEETVKQTYGNDLVAITPVNLPSDISLPENLYAKGFIEEALCRALTKSKPLQPRRIRNTSFIIANPTAPTNKALAPLLQVAGNAGGAVPGLRTAVTSSHPQSEQVMWAEALRVALEVKNGRCWVLIEPEIWIWPQHARREAIEFMNKHRADRLNSKHDALLNAWIQIILGTDQLNAEVTLQAFNGGEEAANPSFRVGTRTAFSRRFVS